MVISSGLSVTPYIKIISEGESIGGLTIEKEKVGIGAVCQHNIDGVLLKAGIPVNPETWWNCSNSESDSGALYDVLTYVSTTVDPLEVLMSQGITSARNAQDRFRQRVLANLREAPMVARDDEVVFLTFFLMQASVVFWKLENRIHGFWTFL